MRTHFVKTRVQALLGAGLLSAMAVFAPASYADYMGTFSVTGTTTGLPGGNPLSGEVKFTIDSVNDWIDVMLTNTIDWTLPLSYTAGSNQFLSQVAFSIANTGVGFVIPSDTDVGAQTPYNLVTYSDGAFPTLQNGVATGATAWTYGANPVSGHMTSGGGAIQLTALPGSEKTMISPLMTSTSQICEQSTAGNCPDGIDTANFNPEFNKTATFRLAFAGLETTSFITNVGFGFGTAPGSPGEPGGDIPVVPIPAAVWLFGSGLLGLIGIARRRQTGAAKAPALA